MAVSNIFKCIGNEVESIPETILDELGLSYEELNKTDSNIVTLSKTLKDLKKNSYCRVPFCHTVEAEAFGSKVTFDHQFGNRIKEYAIENMASIDDLAFDLSKGRIAEVLKAISILKKDGENVVLEITGPITTGTSIIESTMFFKSVRKDKENIDKLLKLIEDGVVAYILEAVKNGVDIISITDPAGTLDIVGPKIYKEVSGKTTYNILKRIENQLEDAVVHLCGKTSTSLEAIGLIEAEKIEVEGQDYFNMIKNLKKDRNDTKFIGHWCLKAMKKNGEVIGCKLV